MKKLHVLFIAMACIGYLNLQAQNIGIGTNTPKAAFNVAANKTVLFGKDTSGGSGKMLWIPSKYALRAGAIGHVPVYPGYNPDSTIWNYDSIGIFSFAAGYQNTASKEGSVALGAENNAAGFYASAFGYSNLAKGGQSFSAGSNNQSTGIYSVSLGYQNIASGPASFAAGELNRTMENYSFAAGLGNDSRGNYSITMGHYNAAKRHYAIAIGHANTSIATGSIAIGEGNTVTSYGCFVAGSYNDSIAGTNPTVWVNTDPVFIVGNGTSEVNTKNAIVILKNGRVGLNTNTPLGQLHIKANSFTTAPTLMLEEEGNDYARINFKNGNPGHWRMEGYAQQLFGDNADAHFNFHFSLNDYILSLRGNGNAVLTGTLFQNSDERLKKNITPLKNVLSKTMQLNGYHYQWKDSARGKEEQIGLLAQEVEQQFPELVMTDDKGKKSVAYGNMVPVLLQAVKEQQLQIDQQKQQTIALKKELQELKKIIQK